MRNWGVVGAALLTSCLLPSVGLVDSFEESAGGGKAPGGAMGGVDASGGTGASGNDPSNAGSQSDAAGGGGKAGNGAMTAGASGSGGVSTAGAAGGGGEPAACSIPPYLDECGLSCVDQQTDDEHCGECDRRCDLQAGEECVAGDCGCPEGTSLCVGKCERFDTNAHCGTCMTRCQHALECSMGQCAICPNGCAVLTATFSEASEWSNFAITLDAPVDLSQAIFRIRLYSEELSNASLSFLVANVTNEYDGITAAVGGSMLGYQEATFYGSTSVVDISAANRLVLAVTSNAASGGPAKVYIDSIRIEDAALGSYEFMASASPVEFMPAAEAAIPTGSTVTGTVTWVGN